jgi:HD-GYP domain-containing protein (c-di-GMP phosphodiesterase class II)
LRADLTSFATFGAVHRALSEHGVGQLEVSAGVGPRDWVAILSLLLRDPAPGDPFPALAQRLEQSGVQNVQVAPVSGDAATTPSKQGREAARRTYAQSVNVAREAMTGVRMGRGVSVRRVKRAVQTIVDQVLNNEASIVGMTVLRDYDEYTFAHSVNVCIFSIALGKKLGLERGELYELGMGALMHDLGKMRLPSEVTNKTGQLTDDEWALVREHPAEGLLALLEMRSSGELPLRAMLMAYEHHMKLDQSGYPRSKRPRAPTLFPRIVAIADGFDAATSKRSYQSQPWTPDRVLREMRENPARGFDPLLVKAFISMTGFYPVGSLVILDSYELAVVVAPSTQPESHHRPVVRVIYDDLGMPVSPERTLDLNETDPVTGEPLRTIIKTTDPEEYGIDLRQYFV